MLLDFGEARSRPSMFLTGRMLRGRRYRTRASAPYRTGAGGAISVSRFAAQLQSQLSSDAVRRFWPEPSAANEIQLIEDEPLRSPRDDFFVDVVRWLPRALYRLE